MNDNENRYYLGITLSLTPLFGDLMAKRLLSFMFALSAVFITSVAMADPQEIVQLADYVSVDYPDAIKDGKIINEAEYKEMEEFSKRISYLGNENKLSPNDLRNMKELELLIQNKVEPSRVAEKAREISLIVARQFNLITPPKSVPDLAAAATLYQQNCMSCHGELGKGDGPLAGHQDPMPTNFQDLNRAKLRSINGLYNTITMGVAETGMVSYAEQLSDDQRWGLAFYVSQLFASEEQLKKGAEEWKQLKDKNQFTPDRIISRTLGEEEAAGVSVDLITYLRHNPQVLWENQNDKWALTQQLLDESFKALSAGDSKQAYTLALHAYLDGFELLEPVIDTFDSKHRQEIEMMMLSYRQAVQENNVMAAEQHLASLQSELAQTKIYVSEQETHFFSVFLSALIILLREGLEIILVLAVMFVLVKKSEHKEATPYIHSGWISAILVGLGLWFVSHQFITISGAERELSEGILSLLAAGILFYVGFWIHRQNTVQQWQDSLYGKLNKELTKKSLWGFGFIAFIAVFREMLEIALFYETLWLQTGEQQLIAIVSGISVALIILLLINYAINKLSVRLPFSQFFQASSVLIIVLSVVFLGGGLQALVEAGNFPLYQINIPQIEVLGIYPNLWIVLAQLTLLAIGGFIWYKQKKS